MTRTYPYTLNTIRTAVGGKEVIFEEVISKGVYKDREGEYFQYACRTEGGEILSVYPDKPFPLEETFVGKGFGKWQQETKSRLSSEGIAE